MTDKNTLVFLVDLIVSRQSPGVWSVCGGFSDGSTIRLVSVGEGESDPRSDGTLMVTAQAVASALRFLHRRFEVAELGVDGRTATASIDYDPNAAEPAAAYRSVVLTNGKRTDRFASGDPAADWRDMRTCARETAEILLHSPTCEAFAEDVPGWRLDIAEGLVRDVCRAANP